MEIIKPCKEYLASYYEACQESQGHFDYDYIMHDPKQYDVWKEQIFEQYAQNEKGLDLPKGFLPSATRWIVENGKYIGTINMRKKANAVLREWGGTLGILIRYQERGHGYAQQAIALISKQKDLYEFLEDDFIIITIETSNIPSCKTFLRQGYQNVKTDFYVTQVLGKNQEVMRMIVPKKDFFRDV